MLAIIQRQRLHLATRLILYQLIALIPEHHLHLFGKRFRNHYTIRQVLQFQLNGLGHLVFVIHRHQIPEDEGHEQEKQKHEKLPDIIDAQEVSYELFCLC